MIFDDGHDDDDVDWSQYVQPNSPEALKFRDGAKLEYCRFCHLAMMLPVRSTVRDCGGHEPWRVWFTNN